MSLSEQTAALIDRVTGLPKVMTVDDRVSVTDPRVLDMLIEAARADERALLQAAREEASGAGESVALQELLKDPNAVHLNMLRGGIAKLTPAQIGHLYRGEEAEEVIREVRRQNPPPAPQEGAGENTVGAAEAEVGRYVYRRIEALMGATDGTAEGRELSYLSAVAASVEEYGEEACAGTDLAAEHFGQEGAVEPVATGKFKDALSEAMARTWSGGGPAATVHVGGHGPMVAGYCKACGTQRSAAPCHKCGGELKTPHPDWEEPSIPDVAPIRALAREMGYAIGEHGSKERDLDLIAAPWTADAVSPQALADHIAKGINGHVLATEQKPAGRWSCNIQIDGWFKLIDLSVCPPNPQARIEALEGAVNKAIRILSRSRVNEFTRLLDARDVLIAARPAALNQGPDHD